MAQLPPALESPVPKKCHTHHNYNFLVFYVKEKQAMNFFHVFISRGLYHWTDPRYSRRHPKSKTPEVAEEPIRLCFQFQSFKTLDTLRDWYIRRITRVLLFHSNAPCHGQQRLPFTFIAQSHARCQMKV